MTENRENPTDKVVETLTGQGLFQDANDPTRFVDGNGRVAAYADKGWVFNGLIWVKVD